jgi:tetrahydromethanopterin S-methyltransferase subunit G
MAIEPDNLVLIQLREIRSKLNRLDTIETKLDKSNTDNETFKYQLTHTFGLAGMANLQAQHADAKVDDALERQKRTEVELAEIKRRLDRVEARVE